MSRMTAAITVGAIAGGVLGLLVGLVLAPMTDLGNPFYCVGIGLAVGAGIGLRPQEVGRADHGDAGDARGRAVRLKRPRPPRQPG